MSSDRIGEGLTAATLEVKWKSSPNAETRGNPLNLRIRRALSWLGPVDKPNPDSRGDEPLRWGAAFVAAPHRS